MSDAFNAVIEKGIPVAPQSRNTWAHRWPFKNMAVGDSVAVPGHCYASARKAMSRVMKERGFEMVCRIDGAGYRIWRTK